jgi:hypothetical protein
MNAGGVAKACKSSEHYFVAIQSRVSGKRERNTLATFPSLANNHWKRWLIRDIISLSHDRDMKVTAVKEGPMAHQLVGGVMDHQGYDGYQARERDLAHWD